MSEMTATRKGLSWRAATITVAAAALWLASPDAAFVTGQAVNINGGVVM
jgi:NAD(P)-dependent dehydrogenase (short-subunit alcohol dehydrogenase family)